MRLIDWQYYPKWHISYKKIQNDYADRAWFEYWITIGPIQTRWGGKTWCNHLQRSPEYIKNLKKELIKDLHEAH